MQIDTQRRFEAAWRDVQRYLIDMLARGGVDPITADELTVLPGVDEVLALLAVRELAASGDWDTLVVDCAPTAETLRLLALPEALGWYLQKVFPAHRRLARGMRPLAALLGRGEAIPPDSLFEALLRLNDELASVRGLLGRPDGHLGAPGRSRRRRSSPPRPAAPSPRSRCTATRSTWSSPTGCSRPARTRGVRAGRRAQQPPARPRSGESFAGLPVREVPYRPGRAGRRRRRCARWRDALYGELPGDDPARLSGPPSELLSVDADGDGFVLRMSLPLVAADGSVDAARAGDDLVVTVGAHRRVLTLPSVLRRCEVVGGELVDRRAAGPVPPRPGRLAASVHDRPDRAARRAAATSDAGRLLAEAAQD